MIPLFRAYVNEDVIEPLSELMLSGFIGQGKQVEKFESCLKKFFGNRNTLTVNSATSGLHLAYRLLNLAPGDEVLTTPLTCTATNWPILANGLKIKWVDVDPLTCNIDLDDLERKISPSTKAISIVHWGGYSVDLARLKKIQLKAKKKYGFKPMVIEDCAHAFGSTYKKKKLGNHGNICIYSFQAIKHLTAGDGGAILLPNKKMYKRAKLLRWYGIDREDNSKQFRAEGDIAEWGYKFHMNDINATIGMHNLPHALANLKIYKSNSNYYNKNLKNIEGIESLSYEDNRVSSYWLYTLKVKNRELFMDIMKKNDIIVSKVHERNDTHSCTKEFKTKLPNLDKLSEQMICIPNGWWVTEEQRKYIVKCIKTLK